MHVGLAVYSYGATLRIPWRSAIFVLQLSFWSFLDAFHEKYTNMDQKNFSHKSIRGFRVMPIKFDKCSPTRHIYYKLHQLRQSIDTNMPPGRTLFVLGVPPFLNKSNMKRLFSFLGPVCKVIFHQDASTANIQKNGENKSLFHRIKPIKGYKMAFVIFENANSAKQSLTADFNEPLILSTKENKILTGLAKWCKDFNVSIKKTNGLEDEVEKFMETFDVEVEEKMQQEKETTGIADEEGWITVTRQGKKAGIARTQDNEKRILANEHKKKPRKELQNFYTFQIRESKMEHIVNMRKKFEDDKRRISLMKMARKFRPY